MIRELMIVTPFLTIGVIGVIFLLWLERRETRRRPR
jgi:hypothetical protein